MGRGTISPMPRTPELLLPAGSLEKMRAAYDFGADAVYAGQPRYSLRARNNEFKIEQPAQGISEAKQRGKKLYVTSNLIAHNDKIRTYLRDIEPIIEMKPDGIIMADPGLIMMVREKWPEVPIHLARELSLDEIEKIRQECPDMEIEVFVHGALCIAYSGRCLLSGYFNRRDPNQGTCTNACRWNYKTQSATEQSDSGEAIPIKLEGVFNFEQEQADAQAAAFAPSACGDGKRHPAADNVYLIEETERPGELMPIMEDEHGTYIMNSKDLRAVEHVERLAKIGVDSLKVEGRTKSLYYVARVAQVYRHAIDDAAAGRPFNRDLLIQLEGLASRGYTSGFLERRPAQDYQNYITGHSEFNRSQFCGEVKGVAEGWAEVVVKNRFDVGDTIEVIHPFGNQTIKRENWSNLDGEPITAAPGSPLHVRIPLEARYEGALLARVF